MGAVAWHAGEIGEPIERQIHLARGAAEFVTADRFDQIFRQFGRIDHSGKGLLGIQTGNHHVCPNLVPIFQYDAQRLAILHQHLGTPAR